MVCCLATTTSTEYYVIIRSLNGILNRKMIITKYIVYKNEIQGKLYVKLKLSHGIEATTI